MKWLQIMMMTDDDDDDANSKDVEVVEIGTGEALTMLDRLVNLKYLSKEERNSLVALFISYIVRDTCIRVAHVSNRLRFDTFFLLLYFIFKMVSVINELHCHKKIVTYLIKALKWQLYDIISKSIIYK